MLQNESLRFIHGSQIKSRGNSVLTKSKSSNDMLQEFWIIIEFWISLQATHHFICFISKALHAVLSSVRNYIDLFLQGRGDPNVAISHRSLFITRQLYELHYCLIFDRLCCNIDHHKTIYWAEISETYIRTKRV